MTTVQPAPGQPIISEHVLSQPAGGLAGRIAVVTGTAHGIGAAIADGAARPTGPPCTGVDKDDADLTDAAAVRGFFAARRRRRHPGQQRRRGRAARSASRSRRSPTQDWHAVVDANLTSAFLCTRAVVPGMKERRWGRIVNISSAAGADRQQDRDPGLRQRQGGPDRLHPADGARARPVRHHGQLHRARLHPVQPDHRAAVGELRRRTASASWWRASRCGGSASPRTSPTACSSSPRSGRAGSPARSSPSTAAVPSCDAADAGLAFDAGDDDYMRELAEFVAVPSVSRDADAGDHAGRRAAGWPASSPSPAAGSSRPPATRWSAASGSAPPARRPSWSTATTTCSPPATWPSGSTPPFELAVDGDVVRGRGVTDDKGPVYIVLKTAQAFLAQEGGLPLNVKFLFEGEEEIGSPHLPGYVAEPRRRAGRRPGHLRRRGDVAARASRRCRWPPRAWSRWTSWSRAPAPTCTRAGTAAPSPTRCTRWPRSWPACTTPTARSPCPASTTASRR